MDRHRAPIARNSDADDEVIERTPARLRTLNDLDGRTRAARIAQQLVAALSADLGGDLPAAKQQLVQRAALLGAIAEDAETRWLEGKATDLSLLGTLADRQRRLLETLGLGRVARDVTPRPDATEHVLDLLRQEGAR